MFGFKVAGNFALVPTGKRSKQKLSFFFEVNDITFCVLEM